MFASADPCAACAPCPGAVRDRSASLAAVLARRGRPGVGRLRHLGVHERLPGSVRRAGDPGGRPCRQVTVLQFNTDATASWMGRSATSRSICPAGLLRQPAGDADLHDGRHPGQATGSASRPLRSGSWTTNLGTGSSSTTRSTTSTAPDSQTAVLGVVAIGVPAKIVVSVRSDGDYGLTREAHEPQPGAPARRHAADAVGRPGRPRPRRAAVLLGCLFSRGSAAGVAPRPFLSMPSRCEPVTTTVRADSWQNPGVWKTASYTSAPLTGCDQL